MVPFQVKPAVFVYISCAQTKRSGTAAHLSLDRVVAPKGNRSLENLMTRWKHAVEKTGANDRVRAINLYGGGIWAELRRREIELREVGVVIRIVSAGLGLLSTDAQVPIYDATFSPGVQNAISAQEGSVARNREWWNLLGAWQGPWTTPRTLASTVRRFPKAAHIVALPSDYMSAVRDDLSVVLRDDMHRERIVVLSSPSSSATKGLPRVVQVPGDLYGALGGTRGTVLSRAGLFLAAKLGVQSSDLASVCAALKPLHKRTKPLPVRLLQSDRSIKLFIATALQADRSASHSALLRHFRNAGFACEQTRFRKLYVAVKHAI